MKKNSSSRKKSRDSENSSTTHHNNQREPDSHTQASEPKAITNRSFGLEKVVYSFAAVLIFISGIYFGTEYLPADVEDVQTISLQSRLHP
jgi:hypothetical protein